MNPVSLVTVVITVLFIPGTVPADRVVIHPLFNPAVSLYDNNIALVRLQTDALVLAPFPSIATAPQLASLTATTDLIVYGFGSGQLFGPLLGRKSATVRLTNPATATAIYGTGMFSTQMLFAAGVTPQGPCGKTDIGAPLTYRVSVSATRYIGIALVTGSCGDPLFPAVYLKLESFIEFIDGLTVTV